MTRTLLERLRDVPEGYDRPLYYDTMEEAADYIVSLQAEIGLLRQAAQGIEARQRQDATRLDPKDESPTPKGMRP